MRIAVTREKAEGERRVAVIPETVSRLVESGLDLAVEAGAGAEALFFDDAYGEAGATVVADAKDLYPRSDVVLKVQKPTMDEVDALRDGSLLIAFLEPRTDLELARRLADKGVTAFSMDAIPRIARAQSMDALTSMASITGYKAALIAASSLGKFFPMMMTAAGTIAPAKGLILGAGVAGLQAIATARRIGAVMFAFDVRPAVAEQVASLGATFVEVKVIVAESEHEGGYAGELTPETQRGERELIMEHIVDMDFVISTAAVPGTSAPLLITEDMVNAMKSGSVIVDVAAETGGNCELTRPGETVQVGGVTIHGPLNLPSSMPVHASQMYSRNISTLLLSLVSEGQISLDFGDAIVSGACITHEGRIVHEPTLDLLNDTAQEAEPTQ